MTTSTLSLRARTAHALAGRVLTNPEVSRVDELVASTAAALGVASSSLSLLSDRQVVIAASGAEALGIPRGAELPFDKTLCTNVARADTVVAIDDTRTDARSAHVPVVRKGVVGSYLGAPLRLAGNVIGVLCVMDPASRHWSDDHVEALEGFAAQALTLLLQLADDVRPETTAR